MMEMETYLLYFSALHRTTLINNKYHVFGNALNICRCEVVDKVAICYLKKKT